MYDTHESTLDLTQAGWLLPLLKSLRCHCSEFKTKKQTTHKHKLYYHGDRCVRHMGGSYLLCFPKGAWKKLEEIHLRFYGSKPLGRQAFIWAHLHKSTKADHGANKNLKTATCMQKRLSNITVLIILYNAVLTFAPLVIIIIPATDKKILHSRIDLHFHCLNMV